MRTVIGDLGEEANDKIKETLFDYVMRSVKFAFSNNDRQSKAALLDVASAEAMDKIYNIILKYNKTK